MKSSIIKKFLSLFIVTSMLSACGTRDYETAEDRAAREEEAELQARREIQEKIRQPIEEAENQANRTAERRGNPAGAEPSADTQVTYGDLQILDARLNRYYSLRGVVAATVIGSVVATMFAIYQRSRPQQAFFKKGEWRPLLTRELAYTTACTAALSIIAYQFFIPPKSSAELLRERQNGASITTELTESAREVPDSPVRNLGGVEDESARPSPAWQDE